MEGREGGICRGLRRWGRLNASLWRHMHHKAINTKGHTTAPPWNLLFPRAVQSCWHGLSTVAFTPHADGAAHASVAASEPSTAARAAHTPTASGLESVAAAASSVGGAAPAVGEASSTQGAGTPGGQQQQQQHEEVQGKPDLVEKVKSGHVD